MRIISGKYKGKTIEGYQILGTRPTMDRIRESLFAQIQTFLPNAVCLDLFAGSGSLGIEALSNGAYSCTFVDNNPKVIQVLQKNKQKLNIQEPCQIIKQDYQKFLNTTNQTFDLIFLDPPYHNLEITKAIQIIEKRNLLNPQGLLICEYEEEEILCSYSLWKEKKYGSKKIKIFQR